MLDEEQGRRHRIVGLEPDNMAIEEGLQVIIAMVFQILLIEDGIDIGKGLESSTACFVVDDTNLIGTIRQYNSVKTVDFASQCQLDGIAANS